MKSTNVSTYDEKPPSRCVWCLKPSWSSRETCRECLSVEANLRHEVTEAHALKGGRWVTRGGIKVWDGPRPLDDEQVIRRETAQCGTDSGYRRHLRRREPACDDCKAAHSVATQDRYWRSKGDAA